MRFCFARPRSHYGTGKNVHIVKGSSPGHMAVMPDLDKLARCSLDALSGVVFKDDAQVVVLTLRKCYSNPERMEVAVDEL